ncbi:alkaline phosphatase [Alteromonas sp. D210916BOD_24]|uniref:alkaline phosphatase n=1 Tax=Alteromonas sp. D210916BOD_24 TaxID=3157618 RepID=UPI00399C9428
MIKQFVRVSTLACASVAFLASCGLTEDVPKTSAPNQNTLPKNIIMVVADGMGPAYTTAYRNYVDDVSTPYIENVVFDDILVGNASTYPAQVSGYVTDSAAAATALATGVKSYNGAIGVDVDKKPLQSVIYFAKSKGMRTGLAVTSQIVHATPASYIAHNESRKNYNEIAEDFFDVRVNGALVADVMLGGGTSYFEREDRDILAQFIDAGYEYADSYNRLASLPAGSNVLGLFAPVALPAVLDDTRKNRLQYMTKHAIKHLENDNGFFLLVEASQVDWAGHANDIASAMAEMHDLALTIEYLKDYVASHPDTLVVLTADHSTGGLTIGAHGDYRWSPEYLKNLKASVATIAQAMSTQDSPSDYVASQLGLALTDEELATLDSVADQDIEIRFNAIKGFLDSKTNTGWTTTGHTGVDVEVFAFGAGYTRFMGQIDNTDIAKQFFAFMDKKSTLQSLSPQKQVTTNIEINSSEEKPDDGLCDFKEDWRCN